MLALGFCFGTHCAAADAVAAEETDNPTAGGSVRSVSEPIQPTSLSLGSTCLFCSNESGSPERTEAAVRGSGEASIPEDYTRIVADKVEATVAGAGACRRQRRRRTQPDDLNTDWADYDQSGDTVTAGDRFALQQDGTLIRGETLTYNLEQQTGEAHNVRMETEHGGRRLQSVSRTAEMLGEAALQTDGNPIQHLFRRRCQLVCQGRFRRSRSGKRHRRCQTRRLRVRRRSHFLHPLGGLPA